MVTSCKHSKWKKWEIEILKIAKLENKNQNFQIQIWKSAKHKTARENKQWKWEHHKKSPRIKTLIKRRDWAL